MPKLAANLSMLYNEVPFLERFDAAAAAGFRAVEVQYPYAFAAADICARLERNGLALVLHNFPPGKFEGGERGMACHPDRIDEFQDSVGQAIEYAKALATPQLNCIVGIPPRGISSEAAQATLVANLTFAAGKLKAEGLRLLIEPINTFDFPGMFLTGSRQALEIIDATGSDNIFLQYDIYHMQRMEGELANTIKKNLARIGHMQLADTRGRNEPGTGEINFAYLLRAIDALGYDGWIGCEYKPATTTAAGMSWIEAYR